MSPIAFDAGTIESTLTLDRSPFQQGLSQARADARKFAQQKFDATLGADISDAQKQLKRLQSDLSSFDKRRYAAQVDVDTRSATRGLDEVVEKARQVDRARPTVQARADTDAARAALDRLDRTRMSPKELKVTAQIQTALANIDRVQAQLDALHRKRTDPTITADITDAENKVRAMERHLEALRAQKATPKVEVQIGNSEAMLARLQAHLDGLRDGRASVDLDIAAAEAKLAALQAQIAGVTDKHATIDIDTSRASQRIATLILLIGTLGTAAATAGIAGSGALLGIGAGATAILPGLGAAALGFSGVSDAVKAVSDQQDKSAAAARKAGQAGAASANQQANAAASLRNAERSLENARASAAEGAQRAARAVQRAREQASEGVQRAIERERTAEKALADAVRNRSRVAEQASEQVTRALATERQAREAVNDAYKTARERVLDLQFSVLGGALAERRAVLNVQRATEDLAEARRAGLSGREMEEVRLAYDEATLSLDQQRVANRRLSEEKADSDRRGIAGSREVMSAQQQLAAATQDRIRAERDARERMADADARVEAARADRDKARAEVDKARRDGIEKIRDALVAEQTQQRQSAAAIESALAGVESAQRAVAQAATASGTAATTAADKAAEAMGKLSPAGQEFVRFLLSAEDTWTRLKHTAQEGFLPGLQSGITSLLAREPEINTFVSRYATAMGELAARTGEGLASEKWTAWFDWLDDQATPSIELFGRIAGGTLGGLAGLMQGAAPLWYEMGDAMAAGAERFDEWGQLVASGKHEGFNRFLDHVREYGPRVWETITDLVGAGAALAEAWAPIGDVVLTAVRGVAEFIKAAPPWLLQALTVGVLGLAAAWKGMKVISTITTAAQKAGDGLSVLSGWVGRSSDKMRDGDKASRGFAGGIGRAAGGAVLAYGAFEALWAIADAGSTSMSEAADGFEKGGESARKMADEIRARNEVPIVGDNWLNDFDEWLKREMGLVTTVEDGKRALEEKRATMTGVEAAQSRLTEAQGDYDLALKDHGPTAQATADALANLKDKSRDLEVQQIMLRDKVDEATAAMIQQRDENLASLDANLRKRQADADAAEAQRDLAAAIRDHGAGSDEATAASERLEEQQLKAAEAALQSAGGQGAYNDTVKRFVDENSGPMSETLIGLVQNMDAAGWASIGARVEIDNTGAAVLRLPDGKTITLNTDNGPALEGINGVVFAMQSVPAGKTIHVNALTEPEQQKLRDLNFTVETLKDGTVRVTANDSEARATLLAFEMYGNAVRTDPSIAANPQRAYDTMHGFLNDARRQTGLPALDADPAKANETVKRKLDEYGRWETKPDMNVDTKPAEREADGFFSRIWTSTRDFFAEWGRSLVDPESWRQGFQRIGRLFGGFGGGQVPPHATGGLVRYATGGALPRYASGGVGPGGLLVGPGTGTSDSIMAVDPGTGVPVARVSTGEYVIRKRAVDALGVPTLDRLNALHAGGPVLARYAAGGGIRAAGTAAGGQGATGDAGAVAVPSGDPAATAAVAGATDALTASMGAAAAAAAILDPTLQALAGTQAGVLAPAQDMVTAGQQNLVNAGIYPLQGAIDGVLQPSLAGYQQQVGVNVPAANTAMQTAQALTQASTTATALNTQTNAGAMTTAVVNSSVAQQYEHGMVRASQGQSQIANNTLAANTQTAELSRTTATANSSVAQQNELRNVRVSQGQSTIANATLATDTMINTLRMSSDMAAMSTTAQDHLTQLRQSQGKTVLATTTMADLWRDQLARTKPDSADPIRWVINYPMRSIVDAWNNLNGQFALDKHVTPHVPNFAVGGTVTGPGGPTEDRIPAMLSNGEFVVRERVASRIPHFLTALNSGQAEAMQAAGAGRPVDPMLRLAGGGPVAPALARARAFAQGESGKPYQWGGVGNPSWDCSGLMSGITHVLNGRNPRSGRLGQTATFPWGGFAPGLHSAFAIGNTKSGGHMAGTLGGVNVESAGGGKGVHYGGPAIGADHSSFDERYHLPVVGGQFVSGGGGGGFFDIGPIVDGAFAKAYREIADVPKFFGGSPQVARDQGTARFSADKVKEHATAKLNEMFMMSGAGGGVADTMLANLIIGIGKAMGFSRKGAEIALVTAFQESNLRNINFGDRDSLGIFQQRPSQGWGTPAQIMNPRYSTTKFYEHLRTVRGWEGMPHTVAAQRVQRSAYPNAYAKWVPQAIALVNASGIYDNGGPLASGGMAMNLSGSTEQVLTGEQRDALTKRLDRDDARAMVGGDSPALVAELRELRAELVEVITRARSINVYPRPEQGAESFAEVIVRREKRARQAEHI